MIYGERVRLRADERSDLPHFVGWLNDPEVRQGLQADLPMCQAEEEAWYENMLKQPKAEHPFAIEARQGQGWTLIGNCGFHQIDWSSRSAEVGIFIGDKTYWNQGYGTEVMHLLLRVGFQTHNLHRVWLRVHADNRRAIAAYEKAGFVHEGCMRQAVYKEGQYVDLLLMSVLRAEWQG